jgi:hypothetical protein
VDQCLLRARLELDPRSVGARKPGSETIRSAQGPIVTELITQSSCRDWDEFVARHPEGTPYHLWGWKAAVEAAFHHITGYLIARRDLVSNRICAALPVYLVSSRVTGRRFVSVPFAPFAGPLTTNPEDLPALLNKTLELLGQVTTAFAEVRTRRAESTFAARQFSDSRCFVHHYLPLQAGLDAVFARVHRKSLRIPITKAMKRGLVCKADCTREDISVYYSIYSAARRKLGLPVMPDTFFFALWDEFAPKRYLKLLLCLSDSRPIGAAILLTFKDMTIIEYGHTLPGHRAYFVDPFLDFHAVRLAWERGCHYVSFGRTAATHSGLMTYKRHWGTQEEFLHSYFYPADSATIPRQGPASWKYRAVRRLCLHCPQSMYPLLSRTIYRHMG